MFEISLPLFPLIYCNLLCWMRDDTFSYCLVYIHWFNHFLVIKIFCKKFLKPNSFPFWISNLGITSMIRKKKSVWINTLAHFSLLLDKSICNFLNWRKILVWFILDLHLSQNVYNQSYFKSIILKYTSLGYILKIFKCIGLYSIYISSQK